MNSQDPALNNNYNNGESCSQPPGSINSVLEGPPDNDAQSPLEKKSDVSFLPASNQNPVNQNQPPPKKPEESQEEQVIKYIYPHEGFVPPQLANYALPQSISPVLTAVGVAVDEHHLLDADEYPEIWNEIREVGMGLGFIGGLIFYGWYYYKRRISPLRKVNKKNPAARKTALLAEAVKLKDTLISWVDRYESGSMFGMNVGNAIGAALPLPPVVADFFKTILGYIIGCIVGLVFAVCMDDKVTADKTSIYNWGKDGWTTYSKTGMMVGGWAGALAMGLIGLFLPIPGGMILGLALGTAAGSVIGYLGMAGGVPLVNTFIAKFSNKVQNPTDQEETPYRSNYIRAGIALGVAIGQIVGFVLALFPPFCMIPFASIVMGTIFAALFALIGAAVIGIAGPYISKSLDPQNQSSDQWDYGFRSGSGYGKELGNVVGLSYKVAGGDPQYELKNVASGAMALITGAVSLIHDVFFPNVNESTKPLIPWSKRIWLFGSIGGLLGSAIGVAGGPAGILIGSSVGYLLFGAIGVIWGDQILRSIYQYENKFLNDLLDKFGVPGPENDPVPIKTNELKLDEYDKHMRDHDHTKQSSKDESKEQPKPSSLPSSTSSFKPLLITPLSSSDSMPAPKRESSTEEFKKPVPFSESPHILVRTVQKPPQNEKIQRPPQNEMEFSDRDLSMGPS